MMVYRFRPETDCRLQAVAAASKVLQTYGMDAHGHSSPAELGAETAIEYDAGVVRNACALLWAALKGEVRADKRAELVVSVCPAVDVLWGQLERDPRQVADTVLEQGGSAYERMLCEQVQLDVTEASWRVLSIISQEDFNPQRWGGPKERRRVLLLATRALGTYQDAAGIAEVACLAIAQVVRQGLDEVAADRSERRRCSGGHAAAGEEKLLGRHAQQDEDMGGWGACECEQCLGGRETLGLVQRAMAHLAHKDGVAVAGAKALHALCLAHAPNVRRALRLGLVISPPVAIIAANAGKTHCHRWQCVCAGAPRCAFASWCVGVGLREAAGSQMRCKPRLADQLTRKSLCRCLR